MKRLPGVTISQETSGAESRVHRLDEQHHLEATSVVLQALDSCELDVMLSYCHFSLQNNLMLDELVPLAEQGGVGLINASPIAMGLLSRSGPPDWHPAGDEIRQACAQAAKLCTERGTELAFLAMQYVLQDEQVATTLVGTARLHELEQNLEAVTTPIDEELLADVQDVLAPVTNLTW